MDSPTERTLLQLLVDGAPLEEFARSGASAESQELALQMRAMLDEHVRHEEQLAILIDTAKDLAGNSGHTELLQSIVRHARLLLGTDTAYMTLYDPAAGDTVMTATENSISDDFRRIRHPMGRGLGGLVAATRAPRWTHQYLPDPQFDHTVDIDDVVTQEGLEGIIGTPMVFQNHLQGVLFVATRAPRQFNAREVGLLQTLASLAAVAIVRARAQHEAESHLASLKESRQSQQHHAAKLEQIGQAHDRFTRLVLDGGSSADVVDTLADTLGGWGALLETGQSVAAALPAHLDPVDIMAAERVAEDARRSDCLITAGAINAIRIPCRREDFGVLVVGGLESYDEYDQRIIERAAAVIGMVALGERASAYRALGKQARVVEELLRPGAAHAARVELARKHGVNIRAGVCVVVALPSDPADAKALTIALQGTDVHAVAEFEGAVVALMASRAAGEAARRLAARPRRPEATFGSSGPVHDLDELPDCHADARHAVDVLIHLGRQGAAAALDDLGFAGLVVGGRPVVQAFVERTLAPILAYDESHGTELVNTLDAYFERQRSPQRAATHLHVHVNTVGQRLARVKELLGDLDTDATRTLEVQLALSLRRLLQSLEVLDPRQ